MPSKKGAATVSPSGRDAAKANRTLTRGIVDDLEQRIDEARLACERAKIDPRPWNWDTKDHPLAIAWWKLVQERMSRGRA